MSDAPDPSPSGPARAWRLMLAASAVGSLALLLLVNPPAGGPSAVLELLAMLVALGLPATVLALRGSLQEAGPAPAPAAEALRPLQQLRDLAQRLAREGQHRPGLERVLGELRGLLQVEQLQLTLHEDAAQGLGGPAGLQLGTPAAAAASPETLPGARFRVALPPASPGGEPLGQLSLQGRGAEAPAARALAEAAAGLLGLALGGLCRRQEERRLALLEERGAIAAELHDSLAQSLGTMKFQVAALQRGLEQARPADTLQAAARDLRAALDSAWREVRELIAAFRVPIGPGGLLAALEDTIAALPAEAPEVHFEAQLGAVRLGVNEEFHLMQIVREALSNTVQHAGAQQAWVRLSPGPGAALTVCIEDDGCGLRPPDPGRPHYGLAILRERARSLSGTLSVGSRPGGGTRVELRFTPQQQALATEDLA
ncbi:ATP-binding protein [Aquariibacter albus]|uniref:histidine kinase n=1 Tax=Aquariibacter albus TaxID=2759899 RepID=A0A839HGQ0_9BURK|nr:ATP-binding protein [Aquariibacter albus]MBB1160376.1 hypothetical protein [Aquariibacter albus]